MWLSCIPGFFFFVISPCTENMFSGLLVPCSRLGGWGPAPGDASGDDSWGCQLHSEAEYWEVYACLETKLHSPV